VTGAEFCFRDGKQRGVRLEFKKVTKFVKSFLYSIDVEMTGGKALLTKLVSKMNDMTSGKIDETWGRGR